MRVRLLSTSGQGEFQETAWEKPPHGENEIHVRSIMTGVCRSDIAMMQGEFGPLPIDMHGHEGLAEVVEVGTGISDVSPGDLVATRGEPAYADHYNVRAQEYVKVPSAEPKYILEPVACAVNVVLQNSQALNQKNGGRLAILGSGFLAQIVYQTLILQGYDYDITVVGHYNHAAWPTLSTRLTGTYDVIIDLSKSTDYLSGEHISNAALIVFAVEKSVNCNFGPLLWRACTMSFPSPRTPDFYHAMVLARDYVSSGALKVDNMWTRAYNRDKEWQQAFADAADRTGNYTRGYIEWR